jgi:hypothetical protein
MTSSIKKLDNTKDKFHDFIKLCSSGNDYRLTPKSEISPYALCFMIFGRHLLGDGKYLNANLDQLNSTLRSNLEKFRKDCQSRRINLKIDKAYLQLLTFTLSSLFILGTLSSDPLEEYIEQLVDSDICELLKKAGTFNGVGRTGNLAMFHAILLIHAKENLGWDTSSEIDDWVSIHLDTMNSFGFWGEFKGMSHLQFQNGYHQYEIFEYLGIKNKKLKEAIAAVTSLSDSQGHFAPYPGGGGCYDYDAIFILTNVHQNMNETTKKLLNLTFSTLSGEQAFNGGWGESKYIRPRSLKNLSRFLLTILKGLPDIQLFYERLRYAITLQRIKNNRIHTHWTEYSRCWDEANLWDSWFRLLTMARIQVALDPLSAKNWGFINFPGIGYHYSLGKK